MKFPKFTNPFILSAFILQQIFVCISLYLTLSTNYPAIMVALTWN